MVPEIASMELEIETKMGKNFFPLLFPFLFLRSKKEKKRKIKKRRDELRAKNYAAWNQSRHRESIDERRGGGGNDKRFRVHAEFQIFLTVSWTYDETTVPTRRAKLNARMNDAGTGSLTVEFEDGLMGIWKSLIKQSGWRMMKKTFEQFFLLFSFYLNEDIYMWEYIFQK